MPLGVGISVAGDLGRLSLFEELAAECREWLDLSGHSDWGRGYAREYREHGYPAATLFVARKELHEIRERPQPDLWDLASAYVQADMREEALRTLFQGLATHEPGLLQLRVDPDFDSLRNDPRFAELIRQIGFPAN